MTNFAIRGEWKKRKMAQKSGRDGWGVQFYAVKFENGWRFEFEN